MRLVLDTNVYVSAVLSSGGPPAQLVRLANEGAFEIVVSPKLLRELEAVLRRDYVVGRVGVDVVDDLLERLRRDAVVVDDPEEPRHATADPADDYLVALSPVDALVSGDAHLLDATGVRVLTPREAVELLERLG